MCDGVCGYAYVCMGLVCAGLCGNEFTEYLLETRVLTSVDFNMYLNMMCLKMCSLRGGDFRNRFSVFGLYVMPTHG